MDTVVSDAAQIEQVMWAVSGKRAKVPARPNPADARPTLLGEANAYAALRNACVRLRRRGCDFRALGVGVARLAGWGGRGGGKAASMGWAISGNGP